MIRFGVVVEEDGGGGVDRAWAEEGADVVVGAW